VDASDKQPEPRPRPPWAVGGARWRPDDPRRGRDAHTDSHTTGEEKETGASVAMRGPFRRPGVIPAAVGACVLGGGVALLVVGYSKDDTGARRSDAATGPLWVVPGMMLVLIGLAFIVYVLASFLIQRRKNH
jgi:hypothetical protein